MSSYSYYGLYRAASSDEEDAVETPFDPSDDEDDLASDGEDDAQTEEELANPATVAEDISSYYATTAGSLDGEANLCYGPSYSDPEENISYGPADESDDEATTSPVKEMGRTLKSGGLQESLTPSEEVEENISYGPDSGEDSNVCYGPDSGGNVSYSPDAEENISYGPSDGSEGTNTSYGPADGEENVCYGPSDGGEEDNISYGPSDSGEEKASSTGGRSRRKSAPQTEAELKKLPSLTRGSSQSKSKLRLVIGPGQKGKSKSKAEAGRKYPAPPTPAPADPSSIKQECHWNTQFQEALDMDEGKTKWEKLAHLARDFVYCSKTYGKIIISEYYLPEEEKTIKSIDAGGVAGGSKYICSNIFFKFALDTDLLENARKAKGLSEQQLPPLWMYGGAQGPDDCAAMKGCKNDMIGLMSYYNTSTPGLYFPLMSIIDYRGFRLIAMSILPITRTSIKYGSADGGKTVHTKLKSLNAKMKQVGESLNLKGHRTGAQQAMIYGPGDIEGHLGKDGKFYIVDFGRVFPPEAPEQKGSRKIFYCLLRPEFVRNYSTPLSSDAFSVWGKINGKIHNQEVVEATKFLYDILIPRFANEVAVLMGKKGANEHRLTEMLHSNGINCRHLGRVRREVPCECEEVRNLLLNEMVARTLTTVLRQLLRLEMMKMKIASQEPYKQLVLDFLNALLEPRVSTGSGTFMFSPSAASGMKETDIEQPPRQPTSDMKGKVPELRDVTSVMFLTSPHFWTRDLKQWVEYKFQFGLSESDKDERYDLRRSIDLNKLIPRICQQAGLKLSKHSMAEFQNSENFKLLNFDLRKVSAKVKHLNVIDEAEGNLLFLEATSSDQGRKGLWQATDQKFARAVSSNTNNPDTFVRWGIILMEQCTRLPEILPNPTIESVRAESDVLLNSAKEKFLSALKINNDREEAYFELANTVVAQAAKMQLTRSEDSIAVSIWLLQEAAAHYKTAFMANQMLYNLVLERTEDLHTLAIGYLEKVNSDDDSKIPLDTQRERAFFSLLRAFHMLNCAMSVAPHQPDPSTFLFAATTIKDYLVAGGPPLMGRYLYMAAGSLYESAFLTNPSVSDGQVVYYHQKTHAQRKLTGAKNLRSLSGDPADDNAYEADSVLIFEKQTGREFVLKSVDSDSDQTICKLRSKIDIVVPKDAAMHMRPVLTEDPTANYHTTFAVNRLFHLLGQSAISTNIDICAYNIYNGIPAPQRPFSENLKVFTFHKGNWTFLLEHSVYHRLLLTHVNIQYPGKDSAIKAPMEIHIYGSNVPDPSILTESYVQEIPGLGEPGGRKTRDSFLIASFDHLADMNGTLDQRVRMSTPAQYLIVKLVPPSSDTKELGISSICLRGHQFMNERSRLHSKEKKSRKNKKGKKSKKSRKSKARKASTPHIDSSQVQELRGTSSALLSPKEKGTKAEHQLLLHQRQRLARTAAEEDATASKSEGAEPIHKTVVMGNKPSKKKKQRTWATGHVSKNAIKWNKRYRSAKVSLSYDGLTISVSNKKSLALIAEGQSQDQPSICLASTPLDTEPPGSDWSDQETPPRATPEVSTGESKVDLRASVGNLRQKAACQVLWIDPDPTSEVNKATLERVKKHQPSLSVVQVTSCSKATEWILAQVSLGTGKLMDNLESNSFRVAVSLDVDLDELMGFATELESNLEMLLSSPKLVPVLVYSRASVANVVTLLGTSHTTVVQTKELDHVVHFLSFAPLDELDKNFELPPDKPLLRSKESRSATDSGVDTPFFTAVLNRSQSENSPTRSTSSGRNRERSDKSTWTAVNKPVGSKKPSSSTTSKKPLFQYFEVTVVNLVKGATVMVGLASKDFPATSSMPGWKSGSLGYNSCDGALFCGSSLRPYKFQNRTVQPFGEGDVIGCGYNAQSQQVFWTKNGHYLGAAERGHSKLAYLYGFSLFPTVGFTSTCTLKANFGTDQFRFDLTKVYGSESRPETGTVLRLSKTEHLADIHPYAMDMMTDCIMKHKEPLLVIAGIAQYSRSLQVLLRGHLQYRREVPAVKALENNSGLMKRQVKSIYEQKDSRTRSYRSIDLSGCKALATDVAVAYLLHLLYEPEGLDISGCEKITDEFFEAVLGTKVRTIVNLNLKGLNSLSLAAATAIETRFRKLHTIHMWASTPAPAILRLCSIHCLTSIDFSSCESLDDSTLIAILKQTRRTLQLLNFTECQHITDKSISWITKSTAAVSLETLVVDFCSKVSQNSILKVIATCTNLQNLSIACNSGISNYTDDVVKEFAKRGRIVNMLRLYRCDKITSTAVIALAESCTNITELDLGHCDGVSDEAIRRVAETGKKLLDLDLFNTAVTDATIMAFVTRHTGIRRLSLQRCTKLTAAGVIAILPHLTSCEYLILRENAVANALILAIANAALPKLTFLDISSSPSKISPEVIKFLRFRRPGLSLSFSSATKGVVSQFKEAQVNPPLLETLVK